MKVLIVNGVSGSGKDTLCCSLPNNRHISVIDPVKNMFSQYMGIELQRGSYSESMDRELLANTFENIMNAHPEIIMRYVVNNIMDAATGYRCRTLTICARQPRDIQRIKELCTNIGVSAYTLYIRRPGVENVFDNIADNATTDDSMKYDLYFTNSTNDMDVAKSLFRWFVEETVLGGANNGNN